MGSAHLHRAAREIWFRSCPARSWAVAAGCLLVACGGGDLVLPKDGRPTAIRVVEGDGQSGTVGQPLSSPLIVEVTDAGGGPVQGVTVEFALLSAGDGADIAPSTDTTDASGRTQANVLLGSKVGIQTGEARVAGAGAALLKASFTALATSVTPGNSPPTADFSSQCEALTCQFQDGSSDSDGNLIGWGWNFGDGSTSAEREPVHSYSAPGTYTVTLRVIDNGGSTGESSTQITVSSPASPPSNNPPRADFDLTCDHLRCSFTDRSDDSDGSIAARHWDFGDGTTSTQRDPSHTYQTAGQYQVALTITDNEGARNTRTRTAAPQAPAEPPPPPPPPSNKPPTADFGVQCSDLTCSFTDQSKDDDGSVVQWQWSFGDGATSNDRNPSHSYQTAGRYEVLLTVTDNDGAADNKTRTAEPTAPAPPPPSNKPPTADFGVQCTDLTCSFTDRSKDDDGSVVQWQWNFGDGSTSSDRNPSHSYQTAGQYQVLLTVTDDDGAADSKTRTADAQAPAPPPPPPANQAPVADFDVHCDHLTCTFTDKSKDDDGSIVSWQWNFGDGGGSSEQNPVHTYAKKGRYDVVLTVTDNDGATATKTKRADPK